MPIENLRRHWQTGDDDSDMRCYLSMKNRITVREFVDYMAEHHPGIDVWSVEVNFGTATWSDRPTDEELAARAKGQADQAARHAAWERKIYAQLKEKFTQPIADVTPDADGVTSPTEGEQ